jgi:Retrotransposon gag protein
MMCLSYMKGPKVNDWVWQQACTLQQAVDNGTVQPDNEDIWTAFHGELEAAFTDTTRCEQATLDLISMSMKGDDLDTYMATFEHLRERAGWESNAQGTILLFHRGLKPPLARAIVEQTHLRP